MTNSGEDRIAHCIKFDLTGYCRLICIKDNGLFVFCFTGTHDDCSRWLNKNRGLTITLNEKGRLTPVFVSRDINNEVLRIADGQDLTTGKLYKQISERLYDKIADGVTRSVLIKFEDLESINSEDDIFELALLIEEPTKSELFYDVFVSLKKGAKEEAKRRIEDYLSKMIRIKDITPEKIEEIIQDGNYIDFEQFDNEDMHHFIETFNFQQWMLFMHPEQKKIVNRDFNGSAKLSGVSGSGKTCIIIKRAIRLAEKYEGEKILILTLNKSLAKLINELTDYTCKTKYRNYIEVKSFWELCQNELKKFRPQDFERLYSDVTWKNNEHIKEIWNEFYLCEEGNRDAEVLFPVHQSLLSQNVYPSEYLYQEFDYIRSALSTDERILYSELDRTGRSVKFLEHFREMIIDGLNGWEEKMKFVGIIDYLGLATALYEFLDKISPTYRCILVDEAQDFGTIELKIIRKMVAEKENDIFLAGDIAQQVNTKHQRLIDAGLDVRGNALTIKKNYRNSKEILEAAYRILNANMPDDGLKLQTFEVLNPEYSNFSTPKPLLLQANNINEEFSASLNYLKKKYIEKHDRKACIAICGFSLFDVKNIGDKLGIQVLDGSINIKEGQIYISDLEQTKGFEFDSMCIINCNFEILPDINLPAGERYRDLTKFYVAMTRAKLELILSYSNKLSPFILSNEEFFNKGLWHEHEDDISIPDISINKIALRNKGSILNMTGLEFLHTEEALGIPIELQNKLLQLIRGVESTTTSASGETIQDGWKNIGQALTFRDKPIIARQFGRETYQKFLDIFAKFR